MIVNAWREEIEMIVNAGQKHWWRRIAARPCHGNGPLRTLQQCKQAGAPRRKRLRSIIPSACVIQSMCSMIKTTIMHAAHPHLHVAAPPS